MRYARTWRALSDLSSRRVSIAVHSWLLLTHFTSAVHRFEGQTSSKFRPHEGFNTLRMNEIVENVQACLDSLNEVGSSPMKATGSSKEVGNVSRRFLPAIFTPLINCSLIRLILTGIASRL